MTSRALRSISGPISVGRVRVGWSSNHCRFTAIQNHAECWLDLHDSCITLWSRTREADTMCQSHQNSSCALPPHYKVLPPGEFDSMIVEPLPVCFESFTTTAYPFSRNVAMATNMVTKTKTEDWKEYVGSQLSSRRHHCYLISQLFVDKAETSLRKQLSADRRADTISPCSHHYVRLDL